MSHLGERLSALIDGELSHDQRDRVLAHLAKCEPCRREAAALRLLKRRMRTLGEATAATGLTDRLMAMAGAPGGLPRPLPPRGEPGGESTTRFPVRSLALGALVFLALGLPAAAFVAGGTQAEPGPSVTPAVEMYATQHAINTGAVPAAASGEDPVTGEPGTGEPGTGTGAPSGGDTAAAPAGPGQAAAGAGSLPGANVSQTMKRDMNGVANVSRPPARRDQTAPRTHHGSRRPAGRRLVAVPRGG